MCSLTGCNGWNHMHLSAHNHLPTPYRPCPKTRKRLVVLDHKHINNMSEDSHPWYANINDAFVHRTAVPCLPIKGWSNGCRRPSRRSSHMATVFKVHHGINE